MTKYTAIDTLIREDTMSLRNKITAVVMSIILFTSLITAYSLYQGQLSLVETSKNRELNMVASTIQNTLQTRTREALSKAALIGSLPSVRSAFQSGDRSYLLEQLRPVVTLQRDSFDLQQTSFWRPPATTFLVIFDPNRPAGEDVSHYREILTTASRRQESQKGLEIGRSGPALRGVFPVKDDQGLIGLIDVATDFTSLAGQVKSATGYEVSIFISNDLMEKTALNVPRPESQYIVGGYRSIQSTDWQVVKSVLSPALLERAKDIHTATVASGSDSFGYLSVPLNDFAGRPIGLIVATRSFSDFQRQTNQAMANIVFIALLQTIILAGVMLFVIRSMILRPVAHVQDNLKRLAGGGEATVDDALARRADEVGHMIRDLQAVTRRLAAAEAKPPSDAG